MVRARVDVQLVRDDVADRDALDAWLQGSVRCAGVPVRSDPYGRPEVAARRMADHEPAAVGLADVLHAVADSGRGILITERNSALRQGDLLLQLEQTTAGEVLKSVRIVKEVDSGPCRSRSARESVPTKSLARLAPVADTTTVD